MQRRKILGKQLRLVLFCYNGTYNKYFYFGKCLEMLLNFCRVTSQWLVHKLLYHLRQSQLTCYYSAKIVSIGLGVWPSCSVLPATCPLSSALWALHLYTQLPALLRLVLLFTVLRSVSSICVPSFHLSKLCCVTSASECKVLCYCSFFCADLSLVFFSSNVLRLAYR